MAENINPLILPIGADPSTFEKSIKEVRDGIKTLKAQIEGTAFNLVKPEQIQQLKDLENTYESLQNRVSKTNFNQFTNSSKQARTALNSLSLVAQDAPFGFIGIQNNLPGVIQSFSELTRTSKGVKGALSEIGKSLIGPAGLFLAFSALTSAVTFAVQKYGSLSNAFDALFGKINPLTNVIKRADKAIKDFGENFKTVGESIGEANSSSDKQIIKLEALAETVIDVTKTERARKSALQELQTIDKDRFGRYDIESAKLNGLIVDVQAYTNAIIAKATAEKLSDRASDALANREIQRNLYGQQLKQLDDVLKKYPNVTKAAQDYNKKLAAYQAQQQGAIKSIGLLPTPDPGVIEFENANKVLKITEKTLTDINDQYKDARIVAKQATLEALAFGESLKDPNGGDSKKIKFDFDVPKLEEFLQFEKFFELDNSLKRLDNYADILLDVNAKESERKQILQSLQSESKKVLGQNTSLFDGLKIGTTNYKELTQSVVDYGIAIQQAILDQQKLFADTKSENKFKISDYIAQGLKGVNFEDLDSDVIKNEFDKIKELSKGLPKDIMPSFEEFQTILKELLTLESFKTTEGTLGLDQVTALAKDQLSILKKTIEEAKIQNALAKIFGNGEAALTVDENIANIIGTIKKVKEVIADSLERPFRQFFDTLLDEGKVTFKSFLDLFKDIIKRIASQLIASGIASLITKALFPQTAVAGALGGAVAGGGSSGILKFLGKIFGIKKASGGVNFGGVEASGMQLAGQVVFTQRGSDLVGVLNRTNGTINRVG